MIIFYYLETGGVNGEPVAQIREKDSEGSFLVIYATGRVVKGKPFTWRHRV